MDEKPKSQDEKVELPNGKPESPAGEKSQFAVGYKKPPIHTRFKLGQSGNPKGRPKIEPSFAASCRKMMNAPFSKLIANPPDMTMRDVIAYRHTLKATIDVKSANLVIQASESRGRGSNRDLRSLLDDMRDIDTRREQADALTAFLINKKREEDDKA